MKKYFLLFSILGILFITNKVYSALFIACTVGGDCPTPTYSCGGNTYKDYNSYQQCIQREQAEKERLELEAKQKAFSSREKELSLYKDFFEMVGVNLTLDINEEQYNQWLKELKEAKADYLKEQENQQKIKELEERINTLESKPAVIEKVITTKEEVVFPRNKEEVVKPMINDNKIVKPVIKKEEPKNETIEEKPSSVIENTINETPIIPTEKSFFQRVFGWFKSLF